MTPQEILDYEVAASWWVEWISLPFLQELASKYFAWKVNRKYARYLRMLERKRFVAHIKAYGVKK